MVALRNKDQTLATPANRLIDDDGRSQSKGSPKVSGYEQFREERIKENLERMQKLGIFDLSLKLKSVKPHRKNNYANRKSLSCTSPLLPSGPPRRSSRLQNVTSVSYFEGRHGKKDQSLETKRDLLREEGSKPEVYTDEHEKLLGNTEMTWTLFVDGYGKDGRRIYDQIKGKTCHQCRQKTLGHRTHCSQCGMVQGQFCGDCLYMRYGENVLEANQNPNWICPVCRGICNCSLCRQARGWAPTGPLYKKISQLGFKSVAHYLIQTRRSQNDSEKVSDSNIPLSAKRSLAFSDTEPKPEGKESPISNNYCHEHIKCEENKAENDFKVEKQKEANFSGKEHGNNNIALENSQEVNENHILNSDSSNYLKALSKTESVDNETKGKLELMEIAENGFKVDKQKETNLSENKPGNVTIASENIQEIDETHVLNSDSSNYLKVFSKYDSVDNKTKDKLEFKEAAENTNAAGSAPKSKRKLHCISEPNTDSIAGRLRQRRRMGNGFLEENGMLEESLGAKDMESTAGRLRLRRRT